MNNLIIRMRQYFFSVWKSCYDMEWYREVRQQTLSAAFRYLFKLLGVVVVLSTLWFVPYVSGAITHVRTAVIASIPEDATFTMANGEFSTSLPAATELAVGDFTVVLDPGYEGDEPPEAFQNRIGLYIGKRHVTYQDNIEWRSFSLGDVPDGSFTQMTAVEWIDNSRVTILVLATLMFMVADFFILLFSTILFAALGSASVMLAGILGKLPKTSYRRWFSVALYAVTLPTLVNVFSSLLGFTLPFAYPVLFFMIMYAVFVDERTSPVMGADTTQKTEA